MLHVDLIAPIAVLLDRHARQRPGQVAYWDSPPIRDLRGARRADGVNRRPI